jgi:hypothetical protein
MKTVCVQIGNSDDKLRQAEWAMFVSSVDGLLLRFEKQRHFKGGSTQWEPWQNACWVIEVEESSMIELFARLSATGTKYNQDSIAVMVGETRFI